MNHEVKKKLTNGKHRVIYHAHTTNTIALTFVLPLDDKIFTRELWESATDIRTASHGRKICRDPGEDSFYDSK